jgi:hypothetical protein
LLDLERKNFGVMPWPYSIDRFQKLRKLWNGKMPCVRLKDNARGDPVTITALATYRFSDIVKLSYQSMWLDLALHCDVYFDIITHRMSLKQGRPVARVDICDLFGLSNGDIGLKAASMIKKMGDSSEHYPEMIQRTVILYMGLVGRAVWAVVSPFLPKTTAKKVMIRGDDFKKDLQDMGFVDLPPRLDGTCTLHRSCFDSLPYRVLVKAGSIWEKSAPLKRKGEKIIWDLQNKSSYDIHLRCVFESSEKKNQVSCIFDSRLDGLQSTKGSWTCESAGIATLFVDNSKSYLRSKNLIVHFFVVDAP